VKRILVGTDGSNGATLALRWAAHIAARIEAELVVMTGFVPPDSELPPRRVEALLAEQEQLFDSWSEAARSDDVRVQRRGHRRR
jgi:nucleotide-binding universal stress UspA family protein